MCSEHRGQRVDEGRRVVQHGEGYARLCSEAGQKWTAPHIQQKRLIFSSLSDPPMAIRRMAVERLDSGIFKTSSLVNSRLSIEGWLRILLRVTYDT